MRKLVYYVGSSIDGYIAGPDGSFDFFPLEGDHIEALIAEYPETIPGHFRDALGVNVPNRTIDTVLKGRSTYEVGLREGITNAYPHLRNLLFSRTMTSSPDPTVELVSTDPVDKVRDLKRQDGLDIWLCGGGQLAAALRSEIDVLVVKLYPVVAGKGIPLFDGEFEPQRFELKTSRTFNSGMALLTYQVGAD
ncbi:dihydrofolate reductase family protein [Phytoactinopolyspora limicola]|uniref:dihydrofolate reductase family protein n=1 Tax=Phytoactinopolyspora limicola TaxID=2715536 RepID=UPI00140BB937|nr:dihydrofolate reductase family protein [Phytoactinopolyspora limicola]